MVRSKVYYDEEFVNKERSLHDLAEENNTYPNKIRRELLLLGYKMRTKSEAQKVALKKGRHQHPTKGRERPPEVRLKISTSISEKRYNAKNED